MSADLETLIKHLRDGTGRVELDLPPPQTSGSIEIAAQLARERRIAISRGDRAAYLYTAPAFKKTISLSITEGESRALMAAGAKWIGPDVYAPKPLRSVPQRMLERFTLSEFKAHRETQLLLSRLTMLVGDNASGKTSVLESLALQGNLVPPLDDLFRGGRSIRNLVRRGAASNRITLTASGSRGGETWMTTLHLASLGEQKWSIDASAQSGASKHEATANGDHKGSGHGGEWEAIRAMTGSAAIYRLQADRISAPAYSDAPDVRVEVDGTNTAAVLAKMKLGDDERFEFIEEAMRRLVPSLERVRIRSESIIENIETVMVPRQGSKVYFDFRGAKDVPADGASHGTLILLSLLTALYGPGRPDLILIDDVEQGLHPRAQREFVSLLQDLILRPEFGDLQIVATTHSPYVLDLLDPSAVYAFALNEDGTVASKLLSEHPDAERTKGSLTAGQLWSLDEERSWVLS